MTDGSASTPQERLRAAVQRTFAGHAGLERLDWSGRLAQTWEALSRVLALHPDALAERLAPAFGVPAAGPLIGRPIEAGPLGALPAAFCQSQGLLPLAEEAGVLIVATSDPQDADVLERARFLAGRPVQWRLAAPMLVEDARVVAYSTQAAREAVPVHGAVEADDSEFHRLARALMEAAVAQRASDLHIQPHLGAYIVRIRVDGELRRLVMLQETVGVTLLRHLKARCAMDPTQHLVPQDGRMSIVLAGRQFELRVSALPASRGERLVLRFLDQGRIYRLGQAGFSLAALQALRRAVARPSGLVLMTGPTGCGKTSTLYGMLAELNLPSVNIITVENPVEFRLPGASQVEVNDKAGLSFASALRSILRQDPDIVLIGEIRDAETAEIATQAALTGHLVLSTLHTNDAVTAIPRLLNLGVDPTILADSLAVVVAQRLCRMLCLQCRTPVADPLTPVERHYLEVTRNRPVYRPAGCRACSFTGYQGRLPIVDILEMNPALREAVSVGERRLSVLEGLRSGGLKSMAASGSQRVLSGDTTVAEVVAAVGPGFWPELARHHGVELPEDALAAPEPGPAGGQAMMLVTQDAELTRQLTHAVESLGMRLHSCHDSATAQELLHRDEAISFIVGDMPDGYSLEQTAAALREFRVAVAWSRLPALVLLPPARAGDVAALRAGGSLADFLVKPAEPQELLQRIQRAHAR